MKQILNNFTILNRDTTWIKKNYLFLFTHCVSLTIFSYSLYFSLFFCLLSLTQFFKTAPVLTLWDFSSLLFPSYTKWLNGLTLYFFALFFFSSFNVSHKLNITSSFMWLDFCTSLHNCCWTFVHNYREKRITSILLFGKLLQQAQSTFLTSWQFFEQAHLMS